MHIQNRQMKDSGVAWVGEIPHGWIVVRSKYIIHSNDGGVWGGEPTNTDLDKVVLRSTEQTVEGKWKIEDPAKRNLSTVSYKHCLIRPNDLLITKSSGSALHIGKTALADLRFADNEYYYSNFLQRIRVKKAYLPKFAWYIFNSTFVRVQFAFLQNATSGLGNINAEDIENVYVTLPPLEEQQRIADFLDSECDRIDILKADIQEQINTLEQYKRSVITEAVTHGLNFDVPMKESGAGWMPFVPKHWKVEKFKYHLRLCGVKNQIDKQVLSLYRELGIVPKDSRDDNHNITSEDVSDYRYVRVGDFVVNKMKAWQGSVAVSDYEGIVSPAYYVYEFIDADIDRKYFHYLMRNKSYATEFRRLSGGIREGQWDLPAEALKNTLILLPPIDEQKAIAEYLDSKCAEIEQTIADKKAQRDTLDDYKKSLIFEYVTGKKEVI